MRSPPSNTTSGLERAAASTTCLHSSSERPLLRWMSLTYSSRQASARVESRSSRTDSARVSPISSSAAVGGRKSASRRNVSVLNKAKLLSNRAPGADFINREICAVKYFRFL